MKVVGAGEGRRTRPRAEFGEEAREAYMGVPPSKI